MFAPRKPAIQVGEGLFSAIGGLFRRATPFLKTAFSSGAKMVKKAATSDLAKDVGKTLSEAAGGKQYWSKLNMINILELWLIFISDVLANAAADAISGTKSGDQIKSQAGQRLNQARQDIAGLLRNKSSSTSKKKKGTSKKKNNSKSVKAKKVFADEDGDNSGEDDDEEDENEVLDSESASEEEDEAEENEPPPKKRNNMSRNKKQRNEDVTSNKRKKATNSRRRKSRKYSLFDD